MASALKKRIVLFGPPASGKGTQSELIEEKFEIPACSTGAMLRHEIERGSKLGREADRFLSVGQYLPDDLMIEALKEWLDRHRDGFALDGFPRTVAQAESLDVLLEEWGLPLEAAIYLEVSDEVLEDRVLKRLQCRDCRRIFRTGESVKGVSEPCPNCGGELCRRDDDTVDTFKLRLAEYGEKTEPLIDYYRKSGKLVRINGEQGAEFVFKEIADVLGR